MKNRLQIRDIHKRIKSTQSSLVEANNIVCMQNASASLKSGYPKDIMRSIELISRKSNPIQFESVLELFDALYESGTTGQIVKMGNYICEEAVPKVRDAKETNTNLKRKLGRLKSKVTTKIDNNIEDALSTVKGKVNAAKSNFKKNTDQIKQNVKTGLGLQKRPKTKTEAYIECYESIVESLEKFAECDRIIGNYNDFSKRFNLERLFIENTRINGVKDTVNELCSFADTYDMNTSVKYMLTIESAWYGFEQNGIPYSKKDILETAADYFMMKKDGLKDCKYALENTTIYEPEDMPDCMQVITEEEPEEESIQEGLFDFGKKAKEKKEREAAMKAEADAQINTLNKSYSSHHSKISKLCDIDLADVDISNKIDFESQFGAYTAVVASWVFTPDMVKNGDYANANKLLANAEKKMKAAASTINSYIKNNKLPGSAKINAHDDFVNIEIEVPYSYFNESVFDSSVTKDVFSRYEKINSILTQTESVSIVSEAYDFDKIFNDFKKQDTENKESKLTMLVRKLYTKNVDNIVEETPNFLNWIRLVFVLGTVALNPVLGAIVAIGDIFVRLHFERDETEKMIKCFDNEIKKSETKMKSSKDNEEKARLKEYITALKKTRDKIDAYYEKMLTDKEIDAKYDSDVATDTFGDLKTDIIGNSKDDDDFDFDDDDFNFDDDEDFLEAAVDTIDTISTLADDNAQYNNIGMDTITNMDIFNADDLDSLAKLSVTYPDVWAPELVENAINAQVNRIRKGKVTFENALERFQRLNAYDTALKTLHTYKPVQPSTIAECMNDITALNACMEAVNSIIYSYKNRDVMVEASFINSLKLASEKLKKNIQKLSDKDRTISKNVDVSLSQLRKSMENSLTNENREAVIKGSILPSSSKIIKLAITTGALWLVNPAVAVITALGYLGLSAKHKRKERQLILDELEVELKMCEKYIDIAESKNDMKALKQLFTIQKNLKRQEQRIRYKMKVDFNQNVPKTDD